MSTQIARFVGPTLGLSAPDGPHVGPINLAIRVAMVLAMEDGRVRVFHQGGYQWPVTPQCGKMIENVNTFLYFLTH